MKKKGIDKMTLVNSLPVIWLITILVAIFCEAFTERLVAVWCAPAAAVALVLDILDMSAYTQVVTFVICAVAMISISQLIKALSRYHNKNNHMSE